MHVAVLGPSIVQRGPEKFHFFPSLTPIGYIRTAAFLISRVDMKQIPLLHSDESSLIIVIVLISSYPKTNICPIDFFKNNSYSISARLHSTFNQSLTDLCYGFNTFWSMTNRGRVSYTAGVVFPRPLRVSISSEGLRSGLLPSPRDWLCRRLDIGVYQNACVLWKMPLSPHGNAPL